MNILQTNDKTSGKEDVSILPKEWLFVVLLFYILSLGFLKVDLLPGKLALVRLPDMFFLLFFFGFLYNFFVKKSWIGLQFMKMDIAILFLTLSVGISSLVHHEQAIYLHFISWFSLVLLYFSVGFFLRKTPVFLNRVAVYFIYSGLLISMLGLCGILLFYCGIESPLIKAPNVTYPYLGVVPRASGSTHKSLLVYNCSFPPRLDEK